MKRIPESLIQDIRSKTDIVDLISQYVALNQKGKNYWGICPFHDDNDPSMSVSPDKQIYKCFVCGHGGNVFQFLQDYEKINFVESVLQLGESLNVDMSEYQRDVVEIDPQLKKHYEIMDEAQRFLSYQLFSNQGEKGLKILQQRGYNDELLEKFDVGLALSSQSLTNFLMAKNYQEEDLVAVNLSRNIDGQLKDVFFDRLMFPIQDNQGKVIGYSARSLDKDSNIKYINTGNTSLYNKKDHVYNYHRAKDPARHQKSVIVTEGVTDVFAFSMAGYDNTVSLLGVAGTDEQVNQITRLSKNVVLAFDGDEAGQTASYKIGLKFKKLGCKVSIWYNDSGLDPDDLLRKEGQKALKEGIDNKNSWLDYIMYYAIGNYGLNSFENKKRVAEFIIKHLSSEDELAQNYYLKTVSEKTGLDFQILEDLLHTENNKQSNQRKSKPIKKIMRKKEDLHITIPEQTILKQMINSKEAAYSYRDKLGFLIDERAQELGLILLDVYRIEDEINLADLLSLDIDDDMKNLIISLDGNTLPHEYHEDVFNENIDIIKKRLEQMGLKDLSNETMNEHDVTQKTDLLIQAINNKREGDS